MAEAPKPGDAVVPYLLNLAPSNDLTGRLRYLLKQGPTLIGAGKGKKRTGADVCVCGRTVKPAHCIVHNEYGTLTVEVRRAGGAQVYVNGAPVHDVAAAGAEEGGGGSRPATANPTATGKLNHGDVVLLGASAAFIVVNDQQATELLRQGLGEAHDEALPTFAQALVEAHRLPVVHALLQSNPDVPPLGECPAWQVAAWEGEVLAAALMVDEANGVAERLGKDFSYALAVRGACEDDPETEADESLTLDVRVVVRSALEEVREEDAAVLLLPLRPTPTSTTHPTCYCCCCCCSTLPRCYYYY